MNKVVKVLIVLILVLVAFSTPVLANGKEGECECLSDSEGGKIIREPPHKTPEERGVPPTTPTPTPSVTPPAGDKDKTTKKKAAAAAIITSATGAATAVYLKKKKSAAKAPPPTPPPVTIPEPETKSIGESAEPVAKAPPPPVPPPVTTPEIVQPPPKDPFEEYRHARSKTAEEMAAAADFSRKCSNSAVRSNYAAFVFTLVTASTSGTAAVIAGSGAALFYFYGSIVDKAGTKAQNLAKKKKQKLKVLDEQMRTALKKKQRRE